MYWLECYLLASGGNIIHNITFSGSQPLGIIVGGHELGWKSRNWIEGRIISHTAIRYQNERSTAHGKLLRSPKRLIAISGNAMIGGGYPTHFLRDLKNVTSLLDCNTQDDKVCLLIRQFLYQFQSKNGADNESYSTAWCKGPTTRQCPYSEGEDRTGQGYIIQRRVA